MCACWPSSIGAGRGGGGPEGRGLTPQPQIWFLWFPTEQRYSGTLLGHLGERGPCSERRLCWTIGTHITRQHTHRLILGILYQEACDRVCVPVCACVCVCESTYVCAVYIYVCMCLCRSWCVCVCVSARVSQGRTLAHILHNNHTLRRASDLLTPT